MYSKILSLILYTTIISCHGQDSEKNQDKMEYEILSKYAMDNGYKINSYKEFKEKSLYYLGVKLNDTATDYMKNINSSSEYKVSEVGHYIFTESESLFYQPEIESDITYEQAKDMLYKTENGIGEKFISYNKLLFNDDQSVIYYFLQNSEKNIDIVFDLNYEKNIFLIEKALRDTEINDSYKDYAISILFYNNEERGYRKMLISKIYNKYNTSQKIKYFEDLIIEFYNNYNEIHNSIENKDKCLVFLIGCLIEYDKKHMEPLYYSEKGKAYSYLSKFLYKDKNLSKRLQENNYYSDNRIKELVKNILSRAILFVGKIQDPDGYTNLRKEKNTSSEVIQKIKAGAPIDVLDNSGEWFLVRTQEGNMGYVHKSRVKTSLNDSISILLYPIPDINSTPKQIEIAPEDIEYLHNSDWDFVRVPHMVGYLAPEKLQKHSFLAEEDFTPKKEKSFWDKLFG